MPPDRPPRPPGSTRAGVARSLAGGGSDGPAAEPGDSSRSTSAGSGRRRRAFMLGLAAVLVILGSTTITLALWARSSPGATIPPGATGSPPRGGSPTGITSAEPSAGASGHTAAASAGTASSAPLEFQPALLEGSGDRRVAFDIPEGAAAIAKVSARGVGPFRLQAIGPGNVPGDVLVDSVGPYAGTLLFDALLGQHSVAFDVRSGGPWTIGVEPVGLASTWSAEVPLGGTGDDVELLDQAADGSTSIEIQHSGAGPIRVLAYTDSGELDQLLDASGSIDDAHALPAGTVCLVIRATGTWTLSPG